MVFVYFYIVIAKVAIFVGVVIFNVYSTDGIHWMRSSLRNFLQAADMKEMDSKELKELFGNVSDLLKWFYDL